MPPRERQPALSAVTPAWQERRRSDGHGNAGANRRGSGKAGGAPIEGSHTVRSPGRRAAAGRSVAVAGALALDTPSRAHGAAALWPRSRARGEGETTGRRTPMNDHGTTLGTKGLDYRSRVAQEMIADRAKRLVERGEDADAVRRLAIGELAGSGDLRTEGIIDGARDVSLAEANPREQSAEDRRGRSRLAAAKREAEERGVSL